ncbi:hypothetical protein BD626DRAFT_496083 [Schizophyllum amplum]|uniref:Uncharacterized protein n=1 Tax=Schizophyllum amplum TaxID=97359 RepID=A0A550CEN5_9AGAR|nr:hypothetical protein BD626DRAFT_496083 [Auriculariopsis ampla]
MTRSKNNDSPYKQLKKNIRAEAVKAGINYAEAIDRRNACKETQKIDLSRGLSRRNPGRMDGFQWRGSTFIPPQRVDNGDFSADCSTDVAAERDANLGGEGAEPRQAHVVCLMDLARPAKRKVRKTQFEFVSRPKAVIALSECDEAESVFDEWDVLEDDLYDSEVSVEDDEMPPKRQYAEVMKT